MGILYLPPRSSVVNFGEAGIRTGRTTAVDSFHIGMTRNGQINTPIPRIAMPSKPITQAAINAMARAAILIVNS
jgi:hypothetical protein